MSEAEDYLGRVQATAWAAAGWVSKEGLERVQHLIDHGEPAEGMCSLAWAIVQEETVVPMSLIRAIRRYSEELVPPEFMPENLDSHALADEEPGRK